METPMQYGSSLGETNKTFEIGNQYSFTGEAQKVSMIRLLHELYTGSKSQL